MPDRSFEQSLAGVGADNEALGAARLALIVSHNDDLGARQSAFDCLELWGSYPNHVEPLYAAALLFFECKDIHLGLLAAEYATTMRERPVSGSPWPYHEEATGWHLDLLYARLLAQVGRASEAMAHYGSVLAACDSAFRSELLDEVMSTAKKLPLCEVTNS